MKHPDLYEAYPDIASIRTKRTDPYGRPGASYESGRPFAVNSLRQIASGEGIVRPRIPEEIQYTQRRHWLNNLMYGEKRSDMAAVEKSALLHEMQHGVQERENFARGAAASRASEDHYQRSAGEVEARNVEARKDLTPEQRSATPPWTTQEVPDNSQIVKLSESHGPNTEHLISIVKKYGIAGAAVMLGMSQSDIAKALEQDNPIVRAMMGDNN